MANIGDQLTNPESGMKRIDDTFYAIKFSGNGWTSFNNGDINYNNGTGHSNNKKGEYYEIYCYTSKFNIIANYANDLSNDIDVFVNSEKENISQYNSTTKTKICIFKKEFEKKQLIHLKVVNNTNNYITLDAIDIDEDGYIIYCDDNGKLYYDMTPIMTSNNTPEGYEVNASNYLNNTHLPYKVFNGTNLSSIDCWGVNGTGTGYIQLKCPNKIKISNFILINRNHSDYVVQSPKHISLYGSNDGISFNKIKEFDNIEWTKSNQTLIFQIDTKNYKYYKLNVLESTGDSLFIGELRYLLAVDDTPFYLIKDNSSNNTYSYDEENNILVEVDDISILKENALNNTCIYDLNKVKDLINLTGDNITILSNKDSNLTINGIKNNKELIISNQNLATVNAETIHNFLFDINKVVNGDCKFVISADNGQTWLSWNGSSWGTLINTAPLDNNKIKQYSKLSDSEKIQWNKLRDEIWTSGMSTDIADVDYNSILTNKTIRFAFVLYRPTYDDNIILKDTKWLFDKVGSWHKLSEDDIDIAINSNMCTVTPKLQNLEHVKVNILL